MSSDPCESHFVASLIIPSSFSSCEMSTAKHHNRRLQSAALLSPHPTATHSSWIISYLSWRRSEEDLERNPKTKKRAKKRWMKMKEKSRTPPHIISRHFLPMISQGNQVVVGRRENTYCILLAMFLPALHDMQYCMSRGKEKKNTSSCPQWQS